MRLSAQACASPRKPAPACWLGMASSPKPARLRYGPDILGRTMSKAYHHHQGPICRPATAACAGRQRLGYAACASQEHHFPRRRIMGSINPRGDTRGGANIVGGGTGQGPGPDVMAAAALDGNPVLSSDGSHVGYDSDIMLELR